jgi:hypothetical protein
MASLVEMPRVEPWVKPNRSILMPRAETGCWRLLVRHFWGRFFDAESLAPESEASANVVQALGVLAAPGAFFVLICCPLSLRHWDLVAVRYWLVSYSMAVMAFIMVLEWDALFPDRRDYQILMPLPLRLWTMFLAKVAALGLFLGVFLLDINVWATLFWPGIDGNPDKLRTMLAHITVVLAAGLFAALSIAALHGLLITLLPARVYRRITVSVQTLLMSLLVMQLFLTPVLATFIRKLASDNSRWAYYFPAYWFIGLYERLRPATGSTYLLAVGRYANWGLLAAAAIFVVTYLPGYKLHCHKLLDTPAPDPAGPGALRKVLSRVVDRLLLTSPVERAVFHFMGHTITRSVKHRIFLATYGGFGVALAITHLRNGIDGLLALPMTLSFILVTGLRAAFNFPSELRANWAFQVTESTGANRYLAAMRKWIVTCAILPLFLVLSVMEFLWFPWRAALFHFAFGVTVSVLLMDIMFFGFRKVPFTCARFPGRINLAGLGVAYVLGLIYYSDGMARFERWLTDETTAAVAFFGLTLVLRTALAIWRRRLAAAAVLDYEDPGDPVVRTLDLHAVTD